MCGIAGVYETGPGGRAVEAADLVAMRDEMRHRGPDGEGVWIDPQRRAGLAHRRLAIIDMSPDAAQPMCNEDETVWLTFNGEIYNHAELRHTLEAAGHRFRTDHSDTEVLVHGFEQWGIACLERMRGMFVFALWDGRTRDLWLVRDRVGVKPLYWTMQHGRLAFASEAKALFATGGLARRVDVRGLAYYLAFQASPAPHTVYDGVRKLPPGTWMRVGADGAVEQRRWWDPLERADPQPGATLDGAAATVLELVRDAVKLRKVSDVPVGVFLSGGVDSTTNAVLFAEDETAPIRTFTIGYTGAGDYASEVDAAAATASRVGAEHAQRLLGADDLASMLPKLAWHADEPLGDPVCAALYAVSELARGAGVVVCQVGEGADELFCGYTKWREYLRLQRLQDLPVPRTAKRAALAAMRAAGRTGDERYEFLRRGVAGVPVFWGSAKAFTGPQLARVLSGEFGREIADVDPWDAIEPVRRRFEELAWEQSTLHWMTYADLSFRLPELLLMRVDKMSMAVGLEARVPFLDHRLVEYVLSLPAALKTPGGELKALLRHAVRGVVGPDVLARPKRGFGVPVAHWLRGPLRDEARDTLDDFCRQTGWFDAAAVRRLFETGRGVQPWYMLSLAHWWQRCMRA